MLEMRWSAPVEKGVAFLGQWIPMWIDIQIKMLMTHRLKLQLLGRNSSRIQELLLRRWKITFVMESIKIAALFFLRLGL